MNQVSLKLLNKSWFKNTFNLHYSNLKYMKSLYRILLLLLFISCKEQKIKNVKTKVEETVHMEQSHLIPETIVTDSIHTFDWNGIYTFNETILRYMDAFKIIYAIKITNETSASIIIKVDAKTKKCSANITSFSKDRLVLNYMDNNQDPEELILYKTQEGYEIGGRTIYLLNPPNDRYPIIKE
jgi:hypothetical protein